MTAKQAVSRNRLTSQIAPCTPLWVVQTLRAAPFSVATSRQIMWRFTVLLDALGRPLELVWERVTVADLDESAAGPRQSRGPVGETERIIADLWESVLSVEDVRVDQNFFELGDSSLTAAALLAAVESRFSLRLPFTAVMSHPTVASFATMVGDAVGFGAPPRPTISPLLVPLQTRGTLPPFFGVHPLFGLVYPYVELARHLSADQPFYALQAYGFGPGERPHRTIPDMARAYITALKLIQPQGSYYVGGWPLGSLIALEMAQQLTDNGEIVACLAIVDQATDSIERFLDETPVRVQLERFGSILRAAMISYDPTF